MQTDGAIEEYKEVSNNMRQYGNMRFAQLALFSAFSGALLGAMLAKGENAILAQTETILKIAGLVLVAVFWIMEERAADYWHSFKKRAIELEKELGYSQYSRSPTRRIVTATNAVRFLYLAFLVLWIVALFKPQWF